VQKKKPGPHPQTNKPSDHGTNHRTGTGSCLVLDNGPVDAHEADIDANRTWRPEAVAARQQLKPRKHRLVPVVVVIVVAVVLLGSHEGFDVVGTEQTTDGNSAKTPLSTVGADSA
jgi:hypothetical protein